MGTNIEQLEQQAIKAAISQDWSRAIEINRSIIDSSPDNIAAFNRLGTAQTKSNHPNLAKESFMQVLKLDPHNCIAKNNLAQLKNKPSSPTTKQQIQPCITSFIEEPGKSKVIPLVKIAEPQIINSLIIGQKTTLKASKHKICVTDLDKRFIGYLPDNISNHLIKLIHSGYKYDTYIKSNNPKNMSVFIQETYQSKKLRGTPSFSVNGEIFPKLDAGEPNSPPLEIYDPILGDPESY